MFDFFKDFCSQKVKQMLQINYRYKTVVQTKLMYVTIK